VLKKTEFQTLASKKSNWQPCSEVSVDHTITHTHTHTHTHTRSRDLEASSIGSYIKRTETNEKCRPSDYFK